MRRFALALLCMLTIALAAAKDSGFVFVSNVKLLAQNETRMLAYHFAWPGIGHVAKQGGGFRWYPESIVL
jgi:hypothetical protein